MPLPPALLRVNAPELVSPADFAQTLDIARSLPVFATFHSEDDLEWHTLVYYGHSTDLHYLVISDADDVAHTVYQLRTAPVRLLAGYHHD